LQSSCIEKCVVQVREIEERIGFPPSHTFPHERPVPKKVDIGVCARRCKCAQCAPSMSPARHDERIKTDGEEEDDD
jgi:hypothetical protein